MLEGQLVLEENNTSTTSTTAKITIAVISNTKNYGLGTWLTKNSVGFKDYYVEKPLFSFSTGTPQSLVLTKNNATTGQLERIILINSQATGKIWSCRISARGDIEYYLPLTEEIIRSIKKITAIKS
jgi:hypothetical protein